MIRIAEEKAVERFNADARKRLEKLDIMQSFVNNGLTQEETLAESLLMMCVKPSYPRSPFPTKQC
jgi:hypothetical protein